MKLLIRDQLMWLYGMGMPKSSNIGKKLPDWKGWGTGLKPDLTRSFALFATSLKSLPGNIVI